MDANADVDDFGPPSGSWIVENVDLYTTTVRLGTTREYATFTNGSLANSRILNLKRSEKPNIYMYLKFTMNITQEQLNQFRTRITKFVKDRPREWIKLVSLRCTHFETEQQYLKFALIVQHRESWQSYGTIQVSKSDIYIHALHLQKELKMDYTAPKVPVHLIRDIPEVLARDGNGNYAESSSRFPFHNSPLDDARNEPTPREALHPPSFEDEQVELTGVSTTSTLSTGVTSTIDGSLVRRKGNRSVNSDRSRDSFRDDFNDQSTSTIVGSNPRKGSPGVSSSTTTRSQVSFATEAQHEGMKNKKM
jgi:hypothetical protein